VRGSHVHVNMAGAAQAAQQAGRHISPAMKYMAAYYAGIAGMCQRHTVRAMGSVCSASGGEAVENWKWWCAGRRRSKREVRQVAVKARRPKRRAKAVRAGMRRVPQAAVLLRPRTRVAVILSPGPLPVAALAPTLAAWQASFAHPPSSPSTTSVHDERSRDE